MLNCAMGHGCTGHRKGEKTLTGQISQKRFLRITAHAEGFPRSAISVQVAFAG
jgi:hypothetical protein